MGYTHGFKWNREEAKKQVLLCIEKLRLNRMPSQSELNSFYENSRLSNYISKNGGYKKFASELNLKLKISETTKGWNYEDKFEQFLIKNEYEYKKMNTGEHFDFLINDKVKVDVKVGSRWYIDKSQANSFGINKKYASCDLYVLYVLDNEDEIEKILIIPSYLLKCKTTMSMGKNSKYNKWENRFDLIEKYDNFLENLKEII